MLNCLKSWNININFTNPSKIKTVIYSDIVNLYAQDLNMFTDLFIKYKRKYSVLDKRINLIKRQILNKKHIFLFLLKVKNCLKNIKLTN